MNKERYNQIIDEAYKNFIYRPDYKAKSAVDLMGSQAGQLVRCPTIDIFINKIKTNPEFSEKWGIKIEERELNVDERKDIWNKDNFGQDMSWHNMVESDITILLNEDNIPTKLITLTYNNEKIESYE